MNIMDLPPPSSGTVKSVMDLPPPSASQQQAAPQPTTKQLNPSDVPPWGRENPNAYAAFMTAKHMLTPPDQPSGPGALKTQMEQLGPAMVSGGLAAEAIPLKATGKPGLSFLQRTLLGVEKGAMETPYAQESQRLAAKLNTPLTLGQTTGSAGALQGESALSQNPVTASPMREFYNKTLNGLQTNFDKALSSISKNEPTSSDFAIGENIKNLYGNLVKTATSSRSANWKQGMDAVDKAAGNTRFIQTDNLQNAVESRLTELRNTISGTKSPEYSELSDFAKELAARGNGLSAAEAQAELSRFSKGAAGSGKVFSALDDGADRAISSKLLGAFNEDLDATAANSKMGNAAEALKSVRNQYKADSIALENMKNSNLGKIFGSAEIDRVTGMPKVTPEVVTKKIMNMQPSDIIDVRDMLKEHAPDILQDVKRNMLSKMLTDTSGEAAVGRNLGVGAEEAKFSPKRIVLNFDKAAPQWNAITTKAERDQVQEIINIAARVSKSIPPGSQTASRNIFWDIASAVWSPIKEGPALAARITATKKLAAIATSTDPSVRTAIRTMAVTSPGTHAYSVASTTLKKYLDQAQGDQGEQGR